MFDFLRDIFSLFKQKQLNAESVEGSFVELLQDKKVEQAISMMQDNTDEVDLALTEYNPELHKVNHRANKRRKKQGDYISVKLPRSRQRYINEVALFFLLNNRIKWELMDGSAEAFKLFKEFLDDVDYDSIMREHKRAAGALTESAKLYHIYKNDDGKPECRLVVLNRFEGYELRTLIDQYKKMQAFAYGYTTKNGGKAVKHWDIQTKDFIFNCTRRAMGWSVEVFPNPTGKINVIYDKQPKEWDGVQLRCEREEDVDSRQGDNNNYFSDPIAKASVDVIKSMADPNAIGKFIQMNGERSQFEYINPPQVADGWKAEKADLKASILDDTFTPDFSYAGIKGYGTLTGAALRNALTIGYIKRNRNIEIYGRSVRRERNVILAILKLLHPTVDFDSLKVKFSFSDPFVDDKQTLWAAVGNAKASGIMSTETAVDLLGATNDRDKELERIRSEIISEETKQETTQSTQSTNQNEEGNP